MTQALQLESHGWKLQRGFPMQPRYVVASDERELGNVKSVAVSTREIRAWSFHYRASTRDAGDYVRSFFSQNVGPACRFTFDLPEYVPTPHGSPGLDTVVSGNQGSRTVYVRFAWKNATGVTLPSPRENISVPGNSLLRVTLPIYPPSVTQAVIYATQGSLGTEVEQVTVTNQKTWTQPNAALLVGTAAPATANTAKELGITCRLLDTYKLVRGIGTTYDLTFDVEEAY